MYLICVWMCVSMYHMCVCARTRMQTFSIFCFSFDQGQEFCPLPKRDNMAKA